MLEVYQQLPSCSFLLQIYSNSPGCLAPSLQIDSGNMGLGTRLQGTLYIENYTLDYNSLVVVLR